MFEHEAACSKPAFADGQRCCLRWIGMHCVQNCSKPRGGEAFRNASTSTRYFSVPWKGTTTLVYAWAHQKAIDFVLFATMYAWGLCPFLGMEIYSEKSLAPRNLSGINLGTTPHRHHTRGFCAVFIRKVFLPRLHFFASLGEFLLRLSKSLKRTTTHWNFPVAAYKSKKSLFDSACKSNGFPKLRGIENGFQYGADMGLHGAFSCGTVCFPKNACYNPTYICLEVLTSSLIALGTIGLLGLPHMSPFAKSSVSSWAIASC